MLELLQTGFSRSCLQALVKNKPSMSGKERVGGCGGRGPRRQQKAMDERADQAEQASLALLGTIPEKG